MRINGFRYIEVLSPCPVNYGRRNRLREVNGIAKWFWESSVIRHGADTSEVQIAKGKPLILGNFVKREKRYNKYQEECPTEAIEVTVHEIGEDPAGRVVDFRLLEEECIFCKKCESACLEDALSVIKPFRGSLRLNTSLCPEGCQICADICPTEALSIDEDKKLVITEEFCIYCGACQRVCPEKAIEVGRTQVLHTDVKSGAWVKALEKLTSYECVIKEMSSKSGKKRSERVKNLARLR